MGEAATSLFRRGLISQKQAGKLGILKQTKSGVPTKMADFDGRSKDEGGTRDKGAPEASTRHIDKRQDMGSPARASGAPSSGGSVGKGATGQPVRRRQLDDAATQKPDFPAGSGKRGAPPNEVRSSPPGGGKPVPSSGGKMSTPKKLKAKVAKQGGQYGGGGRDTQ